MTNCKAVDPVPIRSFNWSQERPEETCLELALTKFGPTLSFDELLKVTKIGRSKAYQLISPRHANHDPTFPTGFQLFDSANSPKVFWTHEAVAWLAGRATKYIAS